MEKVTRKICGSQELLFSEGYLMNSQLIKCVMCGSNDIVKQGDFYVCQHCQAKYNQQQAEKLFGVADMHEAGYQFEKGRQDAIKDSIQQGSSTTCVYCGSPDIGADGYCNSCGMKQPTYTPIENPVPSEEQQESLGNTSKKRSCKGSCFASVLRIVAAVILLIIVLNWLTKDRGAGAVKQEDPSITTTVEKAETEDSEAILSLIEPTVIYEGNEVTITATEIKEHGSGYNINLLIENNSELNLGFNAHAYAINGIMTRNNIYAMDCNVAAGKKANATLELKGSVLKEYGISSIRCVDVLFWAYDNDKYFKEFDTGQVVIRTSSYDETHDIISGTNIYEKDGIAVDYLDHVGNDFRFVITNNTDNYINFDFEDLSFNDFTMTDIDLDLYDEVILKNCQIVVTISANKDFLELNKIDNISSIEWSLSIRPGGSYETQRKIGPIIYLAE